MRKNGAATPSVGRHLRLRSSVSSTSVWPDYLPRMLTYLHRRTERDKDPALATTNPPRGAKCLTLALGQSCQCAVKSPFPIQIYPLFVSDSPLLMAVLGWPRLDLFFSTEQSSLLAAPY